MRKAANFLDRNTLAVIDERLKVETPTARSGAGRLDRQKVLPERY